VGLVSGLDCDSLLPLLLVNCWVLIKLEQIITMLRIHICFCRSVSRQKSHCGSIKFVNNSEQNTSIRAYYSYITRTFLGT
jgi:hypothetical protein